MSIMDGLRGRFGPTMVLSVLALGAQGCFSFLADVQGGYTSSTTWASGRQGAAVNASAGGFIAEDDAAEHLGPGLAVRSKFTDDVVQLALSPHVYGITHSVVTPYGRVGANLLQFEHVDDRFAYGMFSPYAEAGLYITPLVLSAFAEYDMRFTSQRNEGFVGIMAGVGMGVSSETPRAIGNEIVK